MRLGPATFAAGLALVVVGIFTSAADLWEPETAERTLAIDLQGVEALDLGASRVDAIVIADRIDGVLTFTERGTVEGVENATWQVRDDVLVLDASMSHGAVDTPTLTLPPTLRRLTGGSVYVSSTVTAPAMRIDARRASWKGDAESLDVQVRPEARSLCDGRYELVSDFRFTSGAVGTLRITMEGGSIVLGDLSKVGEMELHVGDSVKIELERATDMARIRMLPFEGEPTVITDDARPSPYASACAQIP